MRAAGSRSVRLVRFLGTLRMAKPTVWAQLFLTGTLREANTIENILANIGTIGHFHATGIPGRNEPWLGEQNYPAICRAIDELGLTGYIGLECRPTRDHRQSLVARREWFLGG